MDLRQRLTTTDIAHVSGPHEPLEGPWLKPRTVDDEGELATDDEDDRDPLPPAVRDDWTAGGQAMQVRGVQAQWRDKYPQSASMAFKAAKAFWEDVTASGSKQPTKVSVKRVSCTRRVREFVDIDLIFVQTPLEASGEAGTASGEPSTSRGPVQVTIEEEEDQQPPRRTSSRPSTSIFKEPRTPKKHLSSLKKSERSPRKAAKTGLDLASLSVALEEAQKQKKAAQGDQTAVAGGSGGLTPADQSTPMDQSTPDTTAAVDQEVSDTGSVDVMELGKTPTRSAGTTKVNVRISYAARTEYESVIE